MLRVNINDLKLVSYAPNHTGVYTYGPYYFNGIAYSTYANGQLMFEWQHIEGYKDGIQKGYYPDGQPKYLYKLYSSRKHGMYIEWYPSGQLKSLKMYELGHLLWKKVYDENANLKDEPPVDLDAQFLEKEREFFRRYHEGYSFDEAKELEAVYDFPEDSTE